MKNFKNGGKRFLSKVLATSAIVVSGLAGAAGFHALNAHADNPVAGANIDIMIPSRIPFVVKSDGSILGPSKTALEDTNEDTITNFVGIETVVNLPAGIELSGDIAKLSLGNDSIMFGGSNHELECADDHSIEGTGTILLEVSTRDADSNPYGYATKFDVDLKTEHNIGTITFLSATEPVLKIQTEGEVEDGIDFAVWDDEAKSLNFFRRAKLPEVGSTVQYLDADGEVREVLVSQRYDDIDDLNITYNDNAVPWKSKQSECTYVCVPDEGVAPNNIKYWFNNFSKVETFDVDNLDTGNVTDLSAVFSGCTSAKNINVSSWNTGSVERISSTFYNCASLTSVDVSDWDTSSVTYMSMIFSSSGIEEIDVSDWDTEDVQTMYAIFSGCSQLRVAKLDGWSTKGIVSRSSNYMFQSSPRLQEFSIGDDWDLALGDCYLGTPSESYIDGADGLWYGEDGMSYTVYYIPMNQAGTYKANGMPQAFAVKDGTKLVLFKRLDVPKVGDVLSYDDGDGNTGTVTVEKLYRSWECNTWAYWSDARASLTEVVVADEGICPMSCGSWFSGATNLVSAEGFERLDMKRASRYAFQNMFYNCSSLTKLDGLENWDVSKAGERGFSCMFYGCKNLVSVDLSGWTPSSALTSDNYWGPCVEMFSGCAKLESVGDLSGWDVSGATLRSFYKMFYGCTSLKEINLTGWAPTATTDQSFYQMFYNCSALEKVEGIGTWDVSSATTDAFYQMFSGCSSLTSIDLEGWRPRSASTQAFAYMFSGCSKLESVGDLSKWTLDNATGTAFISMFAGCTKLASVNVTNWDTSRATSMSAMFYNCKALTSVPGIDGWDVGNVTTFRQMFSGCSTLPSLDLSEWDVSGTGYEAFYQMFMSCSALQTIGDVSDWDVSNATDRAFASMFSSCYALSSIDIGKWDVSSVTSAPFAFMFESCRALTSVGDISGWKFPNATDGYTATPYTYNGSVTSASPFSAMFAACWALEELDLTNWDVSVAGNYAFSWMFAGCSSLRTVGDLSKWDTSNAGTNAFLYMFQSCRALKTPGDLSKWDTSNASGSAFGAMFMGCSQLESIGDISEWDVHGSSNFVFMFYGCSALESVGLLSDWDLSSVNQTSQYCYVWGWSNSGTGESSPLGGMFRECKKLKELDLSNWNVSGCMGLAGMFQECIALEDIGDIGNWNVDKCAYSWSFNSMFYNCYALKSISFESWNLNGQAKLPMLQDCRSLMWITVPDNAGFDYISNSFPTPSEPYIAGADGKWYDIETGIGYVAYRYSSSGVDVNKGGVFVAVNPSPLAFGVYDETKTTLALFNRPKTVWPKVGETIAYEDEDGVEHTLTVSARYNDILKDGGQNFTRNWSAVRNDITNVVIADEGMAPTNCSYWFSGLSNLEEIEGLSRLDVSKVTTFESMFSGSTKLKSIHVSGWVASSATDDRAFYQMFNGDTSLEIVDNLDGFIVGGASPSAISSMFYQCTSLKEVRGTGNWEVDNVKWFSGVFADCSSLEKLDLSGWHFTTPTSWASFVSGCKNLREISISDSFSQMSNLFRLDNPSLDIPGADGYWHTEDGTPYTSYEMPNFTADTYYAVDPTGTSFAVYDDAKKHLVFFKRSDVPKVGDVVNYADKDGNATSVTVTDLYFGIEKTDGSTSWLPWRNRTSSITMVDFADPGVRPTNCAYWFNSMSNVTEFNRLENLNVSRVTGGHQPSGWESSFYRMFANCTKITKLDGLDAWNTSAAQDMTSMFSGCSALVEINGVENFDTSNVTRISYMFSWCTSLKKLNISNFDSSKIEYCWSMFDGLRSLEELTVGEKWLKNYGTACGLQNPAATNYEYSDFVWHEKTTGDGYEASEIPVGVAATYTAVPEEVAVALYFDDHSLCFYKLSEVPEAGDTYDSKVVEKVIPNIETLTSDNFGWRGVFSDIQSEVTSVTFVDEIKPKYITFSNFAKCEIFELEKLNTSRMTNMSSMFAYCLKATKIDVSHFDTSKVTDMSYMFGSSYGSDSCPELTSLDVSSFDTSKVTNISNMFHGCRNLTELKGIEDFDTSNVTNMREVFGDYQYSQAVKLTELDLSKWDTSKVTNMLAMFGGCATLTKLNLTGWDTSQVTSMWRMFYHCDGLTTVPGLSGFDTSSSTTLYQMFYYCQNLEAVDVTNWDTSKVTDISYMFGGCRSIQSLNVANWDTSQVTTMAGTFQWCSGLTTPLPLANWDTSKVTDMSYMFASYPNLALDLSSFDTSQVTNMAGMFQYSAAPVNLSQLDTSNVTNMASMFNGYKRSTIDLSPLDTSKVTNMAGMFGGAELTTIDASTFDTSNVTDMSYMFGNNLVEPPLTLVSVNLSGWDTSSVTTMAGMFCRCRALKSLDLSGFDTSNVIYMNSMFYECWDLEDVVLTSFNTEKVTSMAYMFAGNYGPGARSLVTLDLSSFDTRSLTGTTSMFAYCYDLKTIYVDPNKWDMSGVTSSDKMFYSNSRLTGQNGTTFNYSNIDKTYARVDGLNGQPGYLTDISQAVSLASVDAIEPIQAMSLAIIMPADEQDEVVAEEYDDIVDEDVVDGESGDDEQESEKASGESDDQPRAIRDDEADGADLSLSEEPDPEE